MTGEAQVLYRLVCPQWTACQMRRGKLRREELQLFQHNVKVAIENRCQKAKCYHPILDEQIKWLARGNTTATGQDAGKGCT